MSACARCGVARRSVRRAVVAAAHRWLQHITRKDPMCGFVQPAAHGTESAVASYAITRRD
jgi:hypothetical protein